MNFQPVNLLFRKSSVIYCPFIQCRSGGMADAIDSKSVVLWACGFDPRLRYHLKLLIFYIIRSIS